MIPIKIQFNAPNQIYVLGFQFKNEQGWPMFLEHCELRYQELVEAADVNCKKCQIELLMLELERTSKAMKEYPEESEENDHHKAYLENTMMAVIGFHMARVGQPQMGDIILKMNELRDIEHAEISCINYEGFNPVVGKIDNNGATCPTCESVVDGFSNRNDNRPEPDDVSICGYCGSVLQFNEDLSVRPADPNALDNVDPKELEFAQELFKAFKARKQH